MELLTPTISHGQRPNPSQDQRVSNHIEFTTSSTMAEYMQDFSFDDLFNSDLVGLTPLPHLSPKTFPPDAGGYFCLSDLPSSPVASILAEIQNFPATIQTKSHFSSPTMDSSTSQKYPTSAVKPSKADLPQILVPTPVAKPDPPQQLGPEPSAATIDLPLDHAKGQTRVMKRKRFDAKEREKVKKVRKIKACIRCRIYHQACDEFSPCVRCTVVLRTAKVFRQPCSKETLDSIMTFRAGNARVGLTRSKFPELRWSSEDPKVRIVQVRYPFKAAQHTSMPTLTLSCRKFIPTASDVLEDVWEAADGERIVIAFPPYACYDISTKKEPMEIFLDQCRPLLEEDMMDELSDDIVRLSNAEASRYSALHESSAVNAALKIRAVVHFCSESVTMEGPDTLDVAPINNEKFHLHGHAPVPSVLDFQIDTMAIEYMTHQLQILIRQLKQRLYGKDNIRAWYEVFLTVFVLLNTLEKVYHTQLSYMRCNSEMEQETLTRVNFVTHSMMKEWELSAQNLIYHFRCVLKGMVPFSLSWDRSSGNRARAALDEEAYSYVRNISSLIKDRTDEFKALRDEGNAKKFERPLVWVAALFTDD